MHFLMVSNQTILAAKCTCMHVAANMVQKKKLLHDLLGEGNVGSTEKTTLLRNNTGVDMQLQ